MTINIHYPQEGGGGIAFVGEYPSEGSLPDPEGYNVGDIAVYIEIQEGGTLVVFMMVVTLSSVKQWVRMSDRYIPN